MKKMGPKFKLYISIIIILCIIFGLFILGITGFKILSGLRSYVGGEGLWAKSQKEASYHLIEYLYTEDPTYYQKFLEDLRIPFGDKQARIELNKQNSNTKIIFEGFIAGGNFPQDIPMMITLYKLFSNVGDVNKAITQWEKADLLIEKLVIVAKNIHDKFTKRKLSQKELHQNITEINYLQQQLNEVENKFSFYMSQASRNAVTLMLYIMAIFSIIGAVICVLMLFFVGKMIFNLTRYSKELKKNEERFRMLTENSKDVIYRISLPDGTYEYVSPASYTVFGYSPEDFYNDPLLIKKIIPSDWIDYFQNEWKKLIKGDMPLFYEYKIIHKSGEEKWLNQRNSLIFNSDSKPIALEGIVTDITHSKILEYEKEILSQELSQAHKLEAIGTLSGGIAHDFNNILSIIIGYTELASLDLPDNSENKQHLIEVLNAGYRAKELVHQILSFTRKTGLHRYSIEIEPLVNDTLKLLRASTPTTIQINTNFKTHKTYIKAIPTQIQQIILNLCTNGIQSMQKNGGILNIELSRTELTQKDIIKAYNIAPGSYIKLSVIDAGIGIDPNVIDKIFDPYFTTKDIGEGSGMGLAVVHGIVINHDGMISAESIPNQGSTFNVYLPETSERPKSIRKEPKISEYAGTEHILVIDDEESIAICNKQILEKFGYKVTVELNSSKAYQIFKSSSESFDLVLTDQTMPEMTGEQLAMKLMHIDNNIPIILCTGYSASIDKIKAESIGIKAFVMKPINSKKLIKTVREVLDNN